MGTPPPPHAVPRHSGRGRAEGGVQARPRSPRTARPPRPASRPTTSSPRSTASRSTDYEEFIDVIGDKKAGDKVKLTVTRGDKDIEITVTLELDRSAGRRAAAAAAGVAAPMPYVGVRRRRRGRVQGRRASPNDSPAAQGRPQGRRRRHAHRRASRSTGFDQISPKTARDKKAGDKVKVTDQARRRSKEIEVTLEVAALSRPSGGRRRRPTPGADARPYGFMYGGQQRERAGRSRAPDGHEYGGVYKSTDGGETLDPHQQPQPAADVLQPRSASIRATTRRSTSLGIVAATARTDGGKTFQRDGGNAASTPTSTPCGSTRRTAGTCSSAATAASTSPTTAWPTWDHLNHAGASASSTTSPSTTARRTTSTAACRTTAAGAGRAGRSRGTGPINEDWIIVSGGDGFVCRVDPNDPDIVYSESQDGAIGRRNLQHRRARRASARAARAGGRSQLPLQLEHAVHPVGAQPEDLLLRGQLRLPLAQAGRRPARSISPEITRTEARQRPRPWPSRRATPTCSGPAPTTATCGSPATAATKWTNVADKVTACPARAGWRRSSRRASSRAAATSCFDAHRSDDDEPYVYVTEDFGQTWKSITATCRRSARRAVCART